MIIFKLFVLAFATQQAFAQLNFGPNGLQMPPINLFSVYYALRRGYNYLTNSGSTTESEKQWKESREKSEIDGELNSNGTSKSNVDDLVLEQVMMQLNVTCLEDVNSCEGMTMEEMVKKANILLDEEDLLRLMEKRSGVNFSPLERLPPEPKSPALLPTPTQRVAGWYGLYWAIFGVLLGLYLALGVPYFLTGMTVQEAEAEEDADIRMREEVEAAALNASSYMTYGENDMMMDDLIAKHMDFLNNNETHNEEGQGTEALGESFPNNTTEASSKIERSGVVLRKGLNPRKAAVSKIGKNGSTDSNYLKKVASYEGINELKRRSGVVQEANVSAENKMKNNKSNNSVKSSNKTKQNIKSTNGKENNKCYEQILCQRPFFGARAISVSRFALNILDWIPGFGPVTEALNRRLESLTEAVDDGRKLSCHKYICR